MLLMSFTLNGTEINWSTSNSAILGTGWGKFTDSLLVREE